MAIAPSSVVSRIRSSEMPSTPNRYCTPMAGIQEPRSMNWKPVAARSNQNHSGRLTRKPSEPTTLATQRTAWSRPLKNGSSRTSAPTSGVKVMIESRWPRKKSIRLALRSAGRSRHDRQPPNSRSTAMSIESAYCWTRPFCTVRNT